MGMRKIISTASFALAFLGDCTFGQIGGRDLYIAKCSACHAPDGSGETTIGRSMKLTDMRPAIERMTDEQLRDIVIEGRRRMPANRKMDDERIRNLTIFLRDLVAGNPDTGRAVTEARAQPLVRADETFRDKCSACHGSDGAGRTTIGKSLNISDLTSLAVQGKSSQELAEIISQGRGRMPAYAKKFSPVQAGQLAAYIKTLDGTAPQKEPVTNVESQNFVPQHVAYAPIPAKSEKTSGTPTPKSPNREGKAEAKAELVAKAINKPSLTARQIYISKCSACHSGDGSGTGTVGKSMRIPSLRSPEVRVKSDAALADIISSGVGKMPGYRKKFDASQIQLLVTYIRDLGNGH